MELSAKLEQPTPLEDAVCKEHLEEQEVKNLKKPLLCTEQFVQTGNPVCKTGAENGVLTLFHTMIIENESVKKEKDSDLAKDEEADRTYYLDQGPGSLGPQPPALNFTTICRHLPTYCGDTNVNPHDLGAELNQEFAKQSESQGEVYCLNITETKKSRNNRILVASSPKTSSAVLEDMDILEQIQDVNQNLSLGHATQRAARCAATNSTGHQSCRLSAFQVSRSSQDGTKDKEVPPEPPEEPVPPARKKARTFYSPEQLEELEKMFHEDHYPDNEKRREIAAAVGVTPQRVMVWFQNRRAKWRKMEKLTVKGNKKCPATTSTLPVGPQQSSQGATLLPMPSLSGNMHDPSTTLKMDTTTVNYSSMHSGQPAQLISTSVASFTGRATPYEPIQTKTISQGTFGSVKEEIFPAIPSPPPIRRASLPLNMVFNPNNNIVPLMLDTPSSEYSPSSQESSSCEVLTYSSQSQSISSPVQCNYPEQLEPTANLENPYYHPSNQAGAFQYPQHQVSQLHHFPIHLSSSVLPTVRLTPATPSKSSTAFFSLPGNGGLVTCPRENSAAPYLQNHIGGQLLIQPSAGGSGYIPAFQSVPWNELYVQGAPFSNPLCSQIQFSSGGGCYSAEQAQYAPKQCMPSSSCLLQLPRAAVPGSTMFAAKQMVSTDSDSNPDFQSQAEHMTPPEEDSDTDNIAKEEEKLADFPEESNQ
ncbi:homeobox protein NOBOX isoform X2 [Hemicordylus capensis]|uniref:homeobox protein NOBOX isoform X2 n=1 Tax=Hemicordylus capensis TaxID=884348 RepID=UPI0023025EFF|nr:homeobox protein NOBOX isoform X2 [Hemicordylus capensis]